MKRRIIITLGMVLALCLAFTTVVMATQATKNSDITYRSIKIVVNGTEIAPVDVNGDSTEPFILNSEGSTYLPVRAIGDALGLSVDWDNATSTVILKSDGTEKFSSKKPSATNETKKATLTYRDISITLDGSKVKLVNANGDTVEPFIYNNSTYLPVRAVATALGCTITWDGDTSTVSITKQKAPETSKLTIKTQPKDLTGYNTDTLLDVIVVDGGTAPYTYKWQYMDAGWYDLTGYDSISQTDSDMVSTLTIKPSGGLLDSDECRVVVTDADGNSVTSDTFSIDIDSEFKIVTQPKDINGSKTDTLTTKIAVAGGNGPYTYQWQIMDGGWYDLTEMYPDIISQKVNYLMTGGVADYSSTLTIAPHGGSLTSLEDGCRVVVTDSTGKTLTSDTFTITSK